jgi:hypothetical protein
MRWVRNVVYSLEEITPMGWLVAAAAALIVLPGVRKGLRSAAVTAASGVLAAGHGLASAWSSATEEVEDIVAEAKHRNAIVAHAVADEAWMPAMARRKGRVKRATEKPGEERPSDNSHN